MKIDTTRFRASLEENRQAYFGLVAAKARLEAEYNFNPKKQIRPLVLPPIFEGDAKEYAISENKLYNTRIEELRSSLSVLESQLGQKVQELVELKNKKKQLERNVELTKEELDTVEKLVKKGAKSNIELISIQKEYSTLQGDLQASTLSIPRIELSIKEAQNKIIEKVKNYKSDVAKDLQEKMTELKKYESKLVSESDKLDKTVIKSSVNGVIKTIHLNTIGGVVKSGVDLIEIVPDSDILFVEAKIDPKDIAFINPSQEVIVKITAYDFSIYGALKGEIREISADSIKDEDSKDGKTYYKVVVQTDKNYLEKDGKKLYIIPGMIASVDIITGK
jgi:adhesin transport system membrane fusion protein